MRLAIVDDHAVVRDGLRWMLSDHEGIELVGEASNGIEALDLVASTEVDIVLLDVSMPDMTGLEVLSALQGHEAPPSVIMLTMHDQPGYVKRAIELGASGYLLKSAGHDELMRALSTVAGGGVYIQGEVTGPLLQDVIGGDTDTEKGPKLRPRELEVIGLVADGLENKQIAAALKLSEATVKSYLKSAFERLGVASRAEAVAVALRTGLID